MHKCTVTHMNAYIFTHGHMNTYIYAISYITLHYYPPVQVSNIYKQKSGLLLLLFPIAFETAISPHLIPAVLPEAELHPETAPVLSIDFNTGDYPEPCKAEHTVYC